MLDGKNSHNGSAAPSTALNERPDWLRITLGSIDDGVIATDQQGRVVFLNETAAALTGWTVSDAAGQPIDQVFHVLDDVGRRAWENSASHLLPLEGSPVARDSHNVLVAKDGTHRPIDDTAAAIENDAGEQVGNVFVFRDYTDRWNTEWALQKALAYADDIIATLHEPFLVLDAEMRVRTANRAFIHSFQVLEGETQGRLLFDLGNGQWNIPRLRELLSKVLTAPSPSLEDFEVEHDFPVLGPRTMLLRARRFPPDTQQAELILLAIEDISERNRQERLLQQSELRYRRLFETAKDGILILDAHTGRVIDANPFMADLLGYAPGEFVGKELWEIGLFKERSENERAFLELQEHGYVRYDHLPLETKGGKEVEVEFVSNVYQMNGRQVAQCNIRDISERRRLEQQLGEQADLMALAVRRKDEFLAMLSHELRNPLSPILYALQVLRLKIGEDSQQLHAHTVIERQVRHLVRLVDDLLEVSRITTGMMRLNVGPVELNALAERCADAFRATLEQKRQELHLLLCPHPVGLEADTTRLEQVIGNLLSNASKFTDAGGQVWLSVQQDGDDVFIRVRDNGTGILPDLLPRIFDLFAQADISLDRSEGGLGIGLALVRSIVEMHGGTVEGSSAGLGLGSEFVVRLPVGAALSTQEKASDVESVAPADPLRILVVDDSVDAANMSVVLLRASGHDARVAHNGPAALELARIFDPEVVLLDIGLPEMDGFEVARRLRNDPRSAHVMLVAVTGYGQDADRQRSKESGFDQHLVKPVEYMTLMELLSDVQRRRG